MIRSAYFIYMRQDQQLTGTGFKSEVAHSSQSINMPNSEWLHFAERSGRRGREWAEEYRRHSSKVELGAHALQQMRAGHLEQGGGLLREFVGEVESVDGEPASVRAVLDRYRHGIEGYYLYCRGEFAGAEQCMRVAHNAVARALNKAEWLLLLAVASTAGVHRTGACDDVRSSSAMRTRRRTENLVVRLSSLLRGAGAFD
jgi:hypothetical protein